jgi:non-specific serine/threonine protein kinase/serine/threonine-protein kinase
MPEPDRWEKTKALFQQALEVSGSRRAEFLAEACQGDNELRLDVEGLLAADSETDGFLETPAAALLGVSHDSSDALPGDGRIGPYVIVRVVGTGGMGVVFEAERADDQFRQRVAIKLIRRGMDSDLIVRRFRLERQILATLNHPNIAALLDGGATPGGQPYLVMEFVDGEPIDDFVHREKLTLEESLRLFQEVCTAVQFAHQNLVIHRDLKPSNVLVTGERDVKLLDFGVAKLLHTGYALTAPMTQTTDRVLTPAYASPEQIRGQKVTTATDVYSLGVILYELLAGRRPFDVSDTSLPELARVICDETPLRPSEVASGRDANEGSGNRGRLIARGLAAELDNIVLMAMRKEPERRYVSAAALADDIRRLLEGRPVLAQRDTTRYRIRKFVQRNRRLAIVGLLGMLSLVAGTVATSWQARNAVRARAAAEQNFSDLHSLTKTLIFDIHDAIADLPGATPARALVLGRGLEYLDSLRAQSAGNRQLLRDLSDAYVRLALLQGQPMGANQGDLAAARRALERSLEIAESLVRTDSTDLAAVRGLALVHEKMSDIVAWMGDASGGVAEARLALAGFQSIAEAQPDSVRAQLSLAISRIKLGDLLGSPHFLSLGDTAGALREYQLADSILGAAPLLSSENAAVRRYVGLVLERSAGMHRVRGDWENAMRDFTHSLRIREEIAAGAGASVNARRDVAVTLQNLCEVHRQLNKLDASAASCERAREIFGLLAQADTANIQAYEDMARVHASVAMLAESRGDTASAAASLSRTAAIREEMLSRDPDNMLNRRLLVQALLDLVPLHLAAARAGGNAAAEHLTSARTAMRRAETLVLELQRSGTAVDRETERLRLSRKMIGGTTGTRAGGFVESRFTAICRPS